MSFCRFGLQSRDALHELLFDRCVGGDDQIDTLLEFLDLVRTLLCIHTLHALGIEPSSSSSLDLIDPLDCIDRLRHDFTVVANRDIAATLQIEGGIHCEFLSVTLPEGLGPFHLPRVALETEVVVAFRPTEPKDLQGKGDRAQYTQARVDQDPGAGDRNKDCALTT